MNQPLITVSALRKQYKMAYGCVEALRGVDFAIERGECVALMGPSGSGKSTLMHLLGCLDLPSSGSYRLDELDVTGLTDRELAKIRSRKIGFVFQSFNLIPQLTVYENVEVPFLYRSGHLEQKDRERIAHSIERVGLGHRMYHVPRELSGGEMQRVAIARALAVDPVLILADEPTGNLDSQTGKAILHLFTELNEQGVTLLIVTHDPSVGSYCRRLLQMSDGLLIADRRRI